MGASRSLGRFYPVDSPLHALDPRAKILAVISLVLGLFFVRSIPGLVLMAVALLAVVVMSRVPVKAFLKLPRVVLFIVVFTALFQALFSRQGEVLLDWGLLEVHEGGLLMGIFLAFRVLLLVWMAGLLTATTGPVALSDGLEDLLSPLRRLRFPSHEVAMMVTIALRFIPTLQEEAAKIIRAQAARGAGFDEGGPIRRARSLLPVLLPLVIGAFRRADELAEAMESRGYRGGIGRTRYRELRFGLRDIAALTVTMLILALGIAL
ncbi:MAG: energy-coupling factor transporter transmembrane component T family protein [Rubrobacteraceae bacterium]